MDKRRTILALVLVVVAYSSYAMYNNTIMFWDAYAYEVTLIDDADPDLAIQVTSQDLSSYPDLVSILEEASQNEWAMINFDDGEAIYQYEALLESKDPDMPVELVFLQTDEESYVINITGVGGMEDQPIYLWVSGLAILAAVGIAASEAWGVLRGRG